MSYSPAIDGLRAVAVLAVVVYHAGLPIPAGFVGVDIFFVISGFLITRLLYEELQTTNRICLVDFYARRARRILPALFTATLATLAAAVVMLPPTELAQTARTAAAAFVFSANLFLSASTTDYFDPAPLQNPMLHLWSLGVEEQFYLVWPIVLLLARRRPVATLSVLAIASFSLAEWFLWNGQQQAAFYSMPTRAWELAIGGLIALRPIRISKTVSYAALVFVIAACFVPALHFPGTGAAPAVLASALLLAGIQSENPPPLLEAKPMVWIGLISYSLYLWHWPVFLLGRGMPPLLLLFLSFALAAISYRIIECPFRKSRRLRPAKTVAIACASLIISACGAFSIVPKPYIDPNPTPSIYAAGCDDWFASDKLKPCKFTGRNPKKTIVLIGDSVAMQWFPAIYLQFRSQNLIVITKSSCAMVDATFFYPRIKRDYVECDRWRDRAIRFIERIRPDVVIVGSSNDYKFSRSEWIEGTRTVMSRLSASASQVRLLRSTPYLVSTGEQSFDDAAYWQAEAVSGMPNVSIVDMNDIVCPEEKCKRKSEGRPVYRDKRHLSEQYVKSIADEFIARLGIAI
ncbi:MAG TPA: acyltransferase family protein [Luteimonas sp.]|nr:acyltransferase family protein [Luteimonas sp.]